MNLTELFYNIDYESNFDFEGISAHTITHNANNIGEDTLLVLSSPSNRLPPTDTRIKAFICSKENHNIPIDLPVIYVDNPRLVYSLIAFRLSRVNCSTIDFIGVTGTNGKTTTATLIYEIMKFAGIKVGMIGTGKIIYMDQVLTDSNYSMTTPDPDILYPAIKQMQDMGCELVVMEVSSHALVLEKVAPIRFKVSVFTSLSSEHMDFHHDMESYYLTKLKLFEQSKNGIFNADDTYSARAIIDCSSLCNVYSIAVMRDAEAMAKDVALHGLEGSEYIFRDKQHISRIKLHLAGFYNIYNSMLAIKCAIEYGIELHTIKNAVESIRYIPGRFEIINSNPCIIIDYAHTEAAFENILKAISDIKAPGQKLFTVFGCGGDRDKEKRPRMARVAEKYSDKIIVTSDNPRNEDPSEIISDILEGLTAPTKRDVIPDRKCAIEYAINKAERNDIILILGKGHEKYIIDTTGFHFFDEKEICMHVLEQRC